MEPGGSMPHSQGLSHNFYPETTHQIDIYSIRIELNIFLPTYLTTNGDNIQPGDSVFLYFEFY